MKTSPYKYAIYKCSIGMDELKKISKEIEEIDQKILFREEQNKLNNISPIKVKKIIFLTKILLLISNILLSDFKYISQYFISKKYLIS